MKSIIPIVFSFLLSGSLLAQKVTPKTIENDLLKTFERINYWDEREKQSGGDSSIFNSLGQASDDYAKKLEYYAAKYPLIANTIPAGKPENSLGIWSDDGLLWIYSWDTRMGGTQHDFENVIQYKSGQKIISISDVPKKQPDGTYSYVYAYDKIFTLKAAGKTYYLCTYYGIFDTHARGEGIKVFAIENSGLNQKVQLIKTKSGLTNKLYYKYIQSLTNSDIMSENTLEYDPKEMTITFPVVVGDGRVTDDVITYKFNGQYFEKVK